jgi:uncharacterized protein YbjT (DUF2867 family)
LSGTVLIYGATGYTGKLIAKVAAGSGARPILAGRNLEKVQATKPLGLASRAFDLGDPGHIDAGIKDASAVLCIAGPFSTTSKPMADACLRNHVHSRGTPKLSRIAQLDQRTSLPDQCLHSAETDVRPPRRKVLAVLVTTQ